MENNLDQESKWYESNDDEMEGGEDISFTEYDISASPNDFNIKTLFDFIDSGIVKIPGFQRNYIWDVKRASKLIESIIIGIPIPQIFLYERERNKFIVIDGQQRYMTIYYFMKKRFPKKEKRLELRKIFDEEKGIPDDILNKNDYFGEFNLRLSTAQPNRKNKFLGLNYDTLDESDRTTFELRTIRNIIIKQNAPDDGDSVVFEVFNRLNSGGVNLKPQEIRTSLYHSKFYDMLYDINLLPKWRRVTSPTPNLNMKDIEFLLRGFAMLINSDNYKPSMIKFLNQFSLKAKLFPENNIGYLKSLFEKFLETIPKTDEGKYLFYGKTGKFNLSVYESIFVACCKKAFLSKNSDVHNIDLAKVQKLKDNETFIDATQSSTASKKNVKLRLDKALEILL